MQRPIKFRAWLTLSGYDNDGNDKDFYGMATKISVHYDGSIGFSVEDGRRIFGGDIFERALDNGTIDEYEDWVLWEHSFELMQYTGLKDKNGQEIYEGDIVSDPNYNDGTPLEVKWSSRWEDAESYQLYACWTVESQSGLLSLLDLLDYKNTVEVIGNRFENPELLERPTND